jgi:hypothetical protein
VIGFDDLRIVLIQGGTFHNSFGLHVNMGEMYASVHFFCKQLNVCAVIVDLYGFTVLVLLLSLYYQKGISVNYDCS